MSNLHCNVPHLGCGTLHYGNNTFDSNIGLVLAKIGVIFDNSLLHTSVYTNLGKNREVRVKCPIL
jgi:hypothetical protein